MLEVGTHDKSISTGKTNDKRRSKMIIASKVRK
jgi:hypothetical protein